MREDGKPGDRIRHSAHPMSAKRIELIVSPLRRKADQI
jgi:hypothetical protein